MRACLPVLITGLVACAATAEETEPPPPSPPRGCISLTPADGPGFLVLPEADLTAPVSADVLVANDCEGTLQVTGAALSGPPSLSLTGFTEGALAPGQAGRLTVRWSPESPGEVTTLLRVDSDDPDQATASLPVEGEAVAPVLDLVDEGVDVSEVPIGCEGRGTLRIRNRGNAPLEVDQVQLLGPDAEDLDLVRVLRGPLDPFDPGEGGPVMAVATVGFRPLDPRARSATLAITSSDPRTPRIEVPVHAAGTRVERIEDVFDPVPRPRADVVMVLDRDADILYHLGFGEALIDSFEDLRRTLDGNGIDARVAVSVTDSGCMLGGATWVEASTPWTVARATIAEMMDLDRDLAALGSDTERGLLRASRMLDADTLGPGGCNEGLVRDPARLALIFLSDERDQSPLGWTDYLADFRTAKDPDGAASLVAHTFGGTPVGCSAVAETVGYNDVTTATGGVFVDLCTMDWRDAAADLEDAMGRIAAGTAGAPPTFPLSAVPVVGTLEVLVDGTPSTSWTYDADAGQIVFDDGRQPVAGQSVHIRYDRAVACPE